MRELTGSWKIREKQLPASNQTRWMATIIKARTAIFSMAPAAGDTMGRSALAKTAAIATYALGLAIASRKPAGREGAAVRRSGRDSGGAVAILKARWRI